MIIDYSGYTCTGEPSVCQSACGNGTIDTGEECDDGNTMAGDRCSATCTLEYDVAEVEPNNTTAQTVTASNHLLRGAIDPAGDVDLYTFTLTAPATVELETYNAITDATTDYAGVGANNTIDCLGFDSQIRIFDANGDVTMDATALHFDDDDGDGLCSYVGPRDSGDGGTPNPQEGMLPAGTYTIKVTHFDAAGTAAYYILDLRIASTTPVAPVAGDLVLANANPTARSEIVVNISFTSGPSSAIAMPRPVALSTVRKRRGDKLLRRRGRSLRRRIEAPVWGSGATGKLALLLAPLGGHDQPTDGRVGCE